MSIEPVANASRVSGLVHKMEPLSPIIKNQKHSATPLTARHQNLAWVNKITSKISENGTEDIKVIFQEGTNSDYSEYESEALRKILQCIN